VSTGWGIVHFYRKAREAGISEAEIAEAERQEKEVYDRYHDKDGKPLAGWLKAPNGKKSNLTPSSGCRCGHPTSRSGSGIGRRRQKR